MSYIAAFHRDGQIVHMVSLLSWECYLAQDGHDIQSGEYLHTRLDVRLQPGRPHMDPSDGKPAPDELRREESPGVVGIFPVADYPPVRGIARGLPEPRDGYVYLVDRIVAEMALDRQDLYFPADPMYDAQVGRVVFRSLGQVAA